MTESSLAYDSLQAHPPIGTWLVRLRRNGFQRVQVIQIQVNLYYFWEKRWIFIAMAPGALMLSLRAPDDLTRDGMIVLAMSAVATVLFITGPVPLPTVALLIIVGQSLLLGIDSTIEEGKDRSLIVVSDSGKKRLKRFVVGSVAFNVMGHAKNSVLNVH